MESKFTKIIDEENVQLSAAVIEKTLKFAVSETKGKHKLKNQYVGEISFLSNFEKLNEAFDDVSEVLEFLKETKNVEVDFQKPSVILFSFVGKKKVIKIGEVPLRKKISEETSSDEENEFSLNSILEQCDNPNKMKNQTIKMCLKLMAQEIGGLKGQKRSFALEESFSKETENKNALQKQMELKNQQNEVKFNELRKQLLEKISRESEKAKNQSTELFEKCMNEFVDFKEQFQNEMQKNQSTDQYMSMLINEKIQESQKYIQQQIMLMEDKFTQKLQNIITDTKERLQKIYSQILEFQEELYQINAKIENDFSASQQNEENEKNEENDEEENEENSEEENDENEENDEEENEENQYNEQNQIIQDEQKEQKILSKQQKLIEMHKSQPQYDYFSFDGYNVILQKQKEKNFIYFIIMRKILDCSQFSFNVKLLKLKNQAVIIGVLDYDEYLNFHKGISKDYSFLCFVGDGRREPNLQKARTTLKEGLNVVVSIDSTYGIIKYFVNNKQITSCRAKFLKQPHRNLFPFIGLANKEDTIQFSY